MALGLLDDALKIVPNYMTVQHQGQMHVYKGWPFMHVIVSVIKCELVKTLIVMWCFSSLIFLQVRLTCSL